MIHMYVNVGLSFNSSFLCITKREIVQIDIFHFKYNSLSRFFFNSSLLPLFPLIAFHHHHPHHHHHHQERERESEKRKTAHFFFPSLSLSVLTILYSRSPSLPLSYCGFFVHIYKYIYILYIDASSPKSNLSIDLTYII